MENITSVNEFHILPFSTKASNRPILFSVFLIMYLIGVMVNSVIVTVICLDSRLHAPMYLFLCNLAFVDMCYTTVTVPKLLDMLRSGINIVSYTECLTQVYFFFIAASSEVLLLFVMGYDRYIAICHPLYYNVILSRKICIVFMVMIWLFACVNAMLLLLSTLQLSFCRSLTIHQFFCDAKALMNISCSGFKMFSIVTYMNMILFGAFPFFCNVVSYYKIICVILLIKSKNGRRKAFSTCSSHVTVMVIYYVNGMSVYMMPKSDQHNTLEQILSVLYTTIIPMVNPLIYSLRNKEIKKALYRLVALLICSFY